MGLDMYFYRRTYVKNWDFMGPGERNEISIKAAEKNEEVKAIKIDRISEIIEQVAYWRKANAIHQWFVDNVQGGVDECQESHVTPDQIRELVELCEKVLACVETIDGELDAGTVFHGGGKVEHLKTPGKVIAQKAIAAAMLPTASGFFFGGTEYDEYYLQDLKDTVEQLKPLLSDGGSKDFYYRASW